MGAQALRHPVHAHHRQRGGCLDARRRHRRGGRRGGPDRRERRRSQQGRHLHARGAGGRAPDSVLRGGADVDDRPEHAGRRRDPDRGARSGGGDLRPRRAHCAGWRRRAQSRVRCHAPPLGDRDRDRGGGGACAIPRGASRRGRGGFDGSRGWSVKHRTRMRRKLLVASLAVGWLALTAVGWVSLVFFVSGLYGTVLMAAGVAPRRRGAAPAGGYRPFVSVIVPARNEQGVIADTVRCLCALDYAGPDGRPRFEVIVVDHRSTDRTPQVLAALQRTLDFTIARPAPEDGVGKAVALNVGLAAARGDAICVFDADARVAPDFLTRLVPYLGLPGVAGVQARKLVCNGGRNALIRAQEDDYTVFQTLTQRSRHRIGGAVILTGNGLITRRDCLEAVGGWNEDALTEDIDLTIRYALRGWTVCYCEHVVVWEEAVPTWRGLLQQRTRWSEGSLRCLFDHGAALLGAPVPWRKRLDFLVFLSSSLVMALSV